MERPLRRPWQAIIDPLLALSWAMVHRRCADQSGRKIGELYRLFKFGEVLLMGQSSLDELRSQSPTWVQQAATRGVCGNRG